MQLHKLNPVFFQENPHLKEILHDKRRGYAILTIVYNNLCFGIPLRSHISHEFCFLTKEQKGLDYTKAVLLQKSSYIGHSFKIPDSELWKLRENEYLIKKQFGKFVDRYIRAIRKQDANILQDYRYATLQNYHIEFGL